LLVQGNFEALDLNPALLTASCEDWDKIPLDNVYTLCLLTKTSKRKNKLRDRPLGLVLMTGCWDGGEFRDA
jgi:hypothetical protein